VIARIKNRHLRRAAIVAFLPVTPFIALGFGLAHAWEMLTYLPSEVRECWRGRR
jgi:hypothetical protein